MPGSDADHLRGAFHAFRAGARLHSEDVARLFATAGLPMSNNRLREIGRDSDRGLSITAAELHALVSAWADEQRGTHDR